MDERNRKPKDPWDYGVYGTGPTEPPKDRGGAVAILLMLVIFLCGIVTTLGIWNIRLFSELSQQEDPGMAIAFVDNGGSPAAMVETEPATQPPENCGASIDLKESPGSVDIIPQEGGMALQDIYTKNIPSVVSVSCTKGNGSSSGTGVVLTSDGYLVTNAHVVEGAKTITVQLTDDRVFNASLVGSDDVSDLAVLYIGATDLIPAEFGDSESLRVGDSVVAIGDPLGVELRGTYTNGIISAINRDVSMDGRTMTLIQTNAALNTGNSGGPLINCYGQVIGINTIKISHGDRSSANVEGLGFAIPSTTVKEIVDQLMQQGYVSGRPTLGIQGDALSGFYRRYYGLPEGLLITQVEEGSYASFYGVQKGDLLLLADGVKITSMEELNRVLYAHEVGDVINVIIYRAGMQVELNLTLTEKKG